MFEQVSIETVRKFWDDRPCNVRHSPQAVGTREYFDEVEKRKYYVEPHIPRFARFERWKGKRVLEIGCGIGTDTVQFARAGAQVTAVDLSERSIDLARRRCEVYGLDNVKFFAANVEDLGRFIPAETYDLVYSFGVLHHTPHPERAFAQAARFTRPGGEFKVMVYHRHSWKVLQILLGSGRILDLPAAIARHSEAQTGCPVTYAYSRRELRALLTRNGFRVEELFADHIFPWRVEDYVQYRYVRAWPFRWMPHPLFRLMERGFGWHLCATGVAR